MDPAEILEALPAAVFVMERDGRPEAANPEAAALAGARIGAATLVELLSLRLPDGGATSACPMSFGLQTGSELSGGRFLSRTGASEIDLLVSTRVLRGGDGGIRRVVATVSKDAAGRSTRSIEGARLAAIVASSDDAIISKTLEGRITSWNAAATRIFGYTPEEIVGESILRIIPPELRDEEEIILGKLRRGERIEHFDTIRVRKDGRHVAISLTISPLRDDMGVIVGASKIARDITQRKRAEALQSQLFDELSHRVNNTLAMMQSIATLSLSRNSDPSKFVASFSARLRALSTVHEMIVRGKMQGADLRALVAEVVGGDVQLSGPDMLLDYRMAMPLALALNELGMDALTGGTPGRREGIAVEWRLSDGATLELDWREAVGGSAGLLEDSGLGMVVVQRVLAAVDGTMQAHHRPGMLEVQLSLPLPLDGGPARARRESADMQLGAPNRILVVEDEALIAMDMEAQLTAEGWDVIGPAGTVEEALALIAGTPVDAALVDANLRGRQVGEIAEALTVRGIPFAFATGYGRSALPAGFREARLLAKPFAPSDLIATVADMLGPQPELDTVSPPAP
jgi:PAS domain S-box-containing protein